MVNFIVIMVFVLQSVMKFRIHSYRFSLRPIKRYFLLPLLHIFVHKYYFKEDFISILTAIKTVINDSTLYY